MDIVVVPVISAVVYLIISMYKMLIAKTNEKLMKTIPIVAGALGALIAVVAYYFVPDVIVASNVFFAVLIGSASGLAATGLHQVFKQFLKKDGAIEIIEEVLKIDNDDTAENTDKPSDKQDK